MITKGVLTVRISDNVLEDHLWPIFKLHIEYDRVVCLEKLNNGIYSGKHLIGMTVPEISEWSFEDYTGVHPEMYHEVFDPKFDVFKTAMTIEDIEKSIKSH